MSSALPDPSAIERVVHTYLLAKDANRPHLMKDAFLETAHLEMLVKTDKIAFPATSSGRSAITDVLVRDFGRTYENVYTFCLQRPAGPSTSFSCDWLVGMSDKANGAVRVGCGRYDWKFSCSTPHLAENLLITIDTMQILPAEHLDVVSSWLAALSYPWCPAEQVLASAPVITALEPVLNCLQRNGGST